MSFDESQIEELAASLRQVGMLEPIELRTDESGARRYVIVYGERRWRAAQRAGLATVLAFIDRDAVRVRRRQLYENAMRVDLNPVELAASVAAVMVDEGLDTKALAEQLRWPLRKVQRLIEIHEGPDELKRAMTLGVDVGDVRRTLSPSHALDVLRAYRLYVREDDSPAKGGALARLDRLIRTVLEEEWSGHKLQAYVGALSRAKGRAPLETGTPRGRTLDRGELATSAAGSASRRSSPRRPLLFEVKRERLTVFLDRARVSEDREAREALKNALLALVHELAEGDAPAERARPTSRDVASPQRNVSADV